MRVSLPVARRKVAETARPLLAPGGARVVLGAQPGEPVAPIAPNAASLFGPRGACLAGPHGPLFVCDTGHHRLMVWNEAPRTDRTPADLLIGQPGFCAEGRNARGEAGPATLNVPTGVAVSGNILAVADAWNDRVLLWHGLPRRSNQPADVVLGSALKWPYGVALHDGRLYVADTGNRRVLVWNSIPQSSGVPADRVVREGMRWPHGIAVAGERVFIADAGDNRVVAGDSVIDADLSMPYGVAALEDGLVVADTANSRLLGFALSGGAPRSLAGQPTLNDKGDNRWKAASRDSLCWPYGVAACANTLVIADSGNNRVLLWDLG